MKHRLELDALFVQSFSPVALPAPQEHLRFAPSAIDFTRCQTNCSCPATP